jgi:hypothetical protein
MRALEGRWRLERDTLRQALNIIAIVVAIVIGHGCGAPSSERDDTTAALSGSAAYFLSPGDKLQIKVFDEPDLRQPA